MKTCNTCGAQNQDNNVFCENCGAPFETNQQTSYGTPASQIPYGAQQNPNFHVPYGNPVPQPLQIGSMLPILRKQGRSPLFLIPVILMTLVVLNGLSVVLNLFGADTQELLDLASGDSEAVILSWMNNSLRGFSLISMIPSILTVVGLWMIYASCMGGDDRPMSTAGFTLVKGVMIYQLVVFCIGIGILVILVFFFSASSSLWMELLGSSGLGLRHSEIRSAANALNWLQVVIFLILAVYSALIITYYVKVIASLSCAKEIIQTGTTQMNKNVSLYVAVLSMLGGAYFILTGFVGMMTGIEVFTSLSAQNLISGIASLLFGILLVSVRSSLNAALQTMRTSMYYNTPYGTPGP